jgi:hypothetical protein
MERIVEMMRLGCENRVLVDLNEVKELLESVEYNEEFFYDTATLVYYHLRAKMKFGYI